MTDDQMKEQKKEILYQFQESENHYNALKVRASSLGQTIEQFGRWMQTNPEEMIFDSRQAHHGYNINYLEPKYQMALNYQEAMKIAEELRETGEKLTKLRESKARLGLR